MPWIRAKNGNVLEVVDTAHAASLVREGHEAFMSDPRVKGAKPKAWDLEGVVEDDAVEDSTPVDPS